MLDRYNEIERSLIKKYRKDIWRKFTKAVREYELIDDGDKIAVCMSGGKDSFILAKCMQELQRHGKHNFSLVFLVMDPGYNDQNLNKIKENARMLNIPITIFSSDIFDIVDKQVKSPCYLCARMRRGCLYSKAEELGCNKIALGHHFDDVVETIMLSMLYGGEYRSMPPKLHSTNFKNMELIRPLYLVREESIIKFSKYNDLEFINCACRVTKKETDSKRREMKALLKTLKQTNKHVEYNVFASSENVNLDTVLGYKSDITRHSFLDDYDK